MDKEEFRIKLQEINELVAKKDYQSAMKIVDSIDWRRVKNVRTLSVVGEIYAANKRYDESREIFLMAYHRAPIGKNILYRLIELSLKMGEISEAEDYFHEYMEVAGNDNTVYVLKYKISSAKKEPLAKQIRILEDYKEKEFTERWSYELAKLYYQAGDKEKCEALCDEIILWFNEGTYVMKAMDLKMRMGVLTGEEKERYENNFKPSLKTADDYKSEDKDQKKYSDEENTEYGDEQTQIESIRLKNDRELGSVESFQEKISKGIRDIFVIKNQDEDEDEENDSEGKNEESDDNQGEEVKSSWRKKESHSNKHNSEDIHVSDLEIPESLKNYDESKHRSPSEEDLRGIYGNVDELVEEVKKKDSAGEFNMEDAILAAATAQGIDIPMENKNKKVDDSNIGSVDAEVTGAIPELEDEEFLSEKDLEEAEKEFLNGPSVKENSEEHISEKKSESSSAAPKKKKDNKKTDDEEDGRMIENDIYESSDKEYESPEEKEEKEGEEYLKNLLKEEDEDKPLSEEEKLEKFIDDKDKDERDPLEVIRREKELTDNEKKLFTYFVRVPGMKDQLIQVLCDAQKSALDKTSKSGNIIVMGGKETGKTRLIASLIPAICAELNLEASKVAYVFAEDINGKDISSIVSKMSGGFLVIEDANQLDKNTVNELNQAMEFRTDGMFVILEDEKIGMRKFLARNPKFARKFTSMINIPVFTNDELVNFARVYTLENGYKIDQMGMLALYNLIGASQKEDEPMNIGAVKELIDTAISKSQGGLLKFNKKKKVDRNGFAILTEKDFTK